MKDFFSDASDMFGDDALRVLDEVVETMAQRRVMATTKFCTVGI